MLSIGQLIWASVRPLLRLVLCVGTGFAITKADMFPVVAARGAGQIALNITIPSLMFSKIVPAFNSSNIHALGPLILVAIIYEALGMLIALIVRKVFWTPHRFRYGILVAGGWGNVGDLPTAIALSICGSSPFGGISDQNLSVAYISAFLLVFMMTLFPLGGHTLVAKDFEGPEVEDDEVKDEIRRRRKALVFGWLTYFRRVLTPQTASDDVKTTVIQAEVQPQPHDEPTPLHPAYFCQSSEKNQHVSMSSYEGISTVVATDAITSTTTENASFGVNSFPQTTRVEYHKNEEKISSYSSHPAPLVLTPNPSRKFLFRRRLIAITRSLLIPASLTIILSFPIALITPLKALFVPVVNSPIPNGPDGLPPLSFLLDTATFIGGASVPLGLICVGSALARLKIPRSQWNSLPLAAISGLAIGKMVVTPILGVLICEGLTKAGLIDVNDKVLRFVCILCSCLPTATTQIFLTQVYSGTGTAEHLPAFLIPQYILMLLTMTALIVFTLHMLF